MAEDRDLRVEAGELLDLIPQQEADPLGAATLRGCAVTTPARESPDAWPLLIAASSSAESPKLAPSATTTIEKLRPC